MGTLSGLSNVALLGKFFPSINSWVMDYGFQVSLIISNLMVVFIGDMDIDICFLNYRMNYVRLISNNVSVKQILYFTVGLIAVGENEVVSFSHLQTQGSLELCFERHWSQSQIRPNATLLFVF